MVWLKAAIVIMSVLIVAGIAVVVVTLVNRMSPTPAGIASPIAARTVLDEPAGTHIAGIALSADRLAIRLEGSGADRVVVVDLRTGKVQSRIELAR